MDLSQLPPAIVNQISASVEDYILQNRKKYSPQAVPMEPEQRSALEPYFPAEILDSIRLCFVGEAKLDDPAFYGMARMMGFKNLPDFSEMAAITFVDVVVSHETFTSTLLFHELVHAVQYAQLGTREFASRYVKGFIHGGYEGIPLEKNAFALEERFNSNSHETFSVQNEVAQWIADGRL